MSLHARQRSVSTPYSFNSNGMQQRPIEIVDTNTIPAVSETFIDGLDQTMSSSHSQLICTDPTDSGASSIQNHQFIQDASTDNVVYNQAPPVVLPQTDMEIEPIDLEEVQKIQARMPAADPTAPVGSNKNPIRIIQQGNQYITTQDVSDEHLQQIIQVLTNQALISSSGSRPNAIYNRLTNRRIIFRVTKAKRRHDDSSNRVSFGPDRTRSALAKGKIRTSGGRKRRKRGSDEEDPDFEPEVPEEEILPFPLARRSSTSGRISKPPKHLVKDYKHLRLEDLTTKLESSDDDDHSDGGYSDYINDGLSEGWSEEDNKKGLRYPCSICAKVFNSRAGVARHESATHGPNQHKNRLVNPYVASMKRRSKLKDAVAAATDEDLIEFVAPRLAKLVSPWDHLLLRSEDGNPPLPQIPRIVLDYLHLAERARAFLGDHLEVRSPVTRRKVTKSTPSVIDTESPEAAEITCATNDKPTNTQENAASVIPENCAKESAQFDCAENVVSDAPSPQVNGLEQTMIVAETEGDEDDDEEVDDGKIIVKVGTQEQSSALGLACGNYVVKLPLREEYLPRRFRSVLATQRALASATPAQPNGTSTSVSDGGNLVTVETADDDEVEATLRDDTQVTSTPAVEPSTATDAQSQNLLALGDELLLIPEGGIGGPVPEEWLTSGAFLVVLTETGETSDLVMEAATGRLFHKPTGHLVSLADNTVAQAQGETNLTTESLPDYGAYEDEQPVESVTDFQNTVEESQINKPTNANITGSGRSKAKLKSRQEQLYANDETAQREQLLQRMAESGEVIDLNTLFPGVSVTEVSPGVCLVTKPNGDRFNVEHGGEGITLETLQTILQMDA
ncbi:hypothetical protein EG68_06139 [Paragonimus skrjabini miyazakii]|uniref:C2H2-type domain-containing protein n=1 Tax=Paragonimus skrjabini miyazakii TaxID=59628 RepID=A0A8S9YXG3_9TREM|nr:hypothetical protein EG68_06139 [Paragonimus skrjabini miyazakii]